MRNGRTKPGVIYPWMLIIAGGIAIAFGHTAPGLALIVVGALFLILFERIARRGGS